MIERLQVGQCLFYRTSGEVVAMMVDEEERAEHFTIEKRAAHIAQMTLAALTDGQYAADQTGDDISSEARLP